VFFRAGLESGVDAVPAEGPPIRLGRIDRGLAGLKSMSAGRTLLLEGASGGADFRRKQHSTVQRRRQRKRPSGLCSRALAVRFGAVAEALTLLLTMTDALAEDTEAALDTAFEDLDASLMGIGEVVGWDTDSNGVQLHASAEEPERVITTIVASMRGAWPQTPVAACCFDSGGLPP
jgi:hypothetical protein